MIAINGVYIQHWTMHLGAAVGGDGVGGGAVVWGRGAGVVGVKGGSPLVLGQVPEAMVCACMPGTPGDWYWVEPLGNVCVRDGEIHFAILEDKCAIE